MLLKRPNASVLPAATLDTSTPVRARSSVLLTTFTVAATVSIVYMTIALCATSWMTLLATSTMVWPPPRMSSWSPS